MAIFKDQTTSTEQLQTALQDWLRTQPEMASATVNDLKAASETSGYSNETYLFTLSDVEEKQQLLVLRMPPARRGVFPHYDMARQYGFMDGLHGNPGIAMHSCYWLENNEKVLGRPFYIVEAVSGEAAPDEPNYVNEGWLFDANPEQRQLVWESTIDQLASLSDARLKNKQQEQLDWPNKNQSRIQQHIQWYTDLATWGQSLLPGDPVELLSELENWLIQHAPKDDPAAVVWGDSRLGNILFKDYRPNALLDWELASIGDPEIDITYLIFHQLLSERMANDGPRKARLPGVPGDVQAAEYYMSKTGRELKNYRYYWLFNAYRMFCMMQSMTPLMVDVGHIGVEEALFMRQGHWISDYVKQVLESDSAFLIEQER